MADQAIGTMSLIGWVTTPSIVIDRLWSYYLASQKGQSYLQRGNIYSFAAIIQKYDGNPNILAEAVRQDITKYFGPHFDTVSVKTRIKYLDNNERSMKYHLDISIIATKNNVGYNVGKELEINGKLFKEIVAGQ